MTIPDNAFWYHAAYAVVVVVYAGYAVSIWWRRRAVARRIASHGTR